MDDESFTDHSAAAARTCKQRQDFISSRKLEKRFGRLRHVITLSYNAKVTLKLTSYKVFSNNVDYSVQIIQRRRLKV